MLTPEEYKRWAAIGSAKASAIAAATREKNEQVYRSNPNRCKQCGNILTYEKRENTYCSHQCHGDSRRKPPRAKKGSLSEQKEHRIATLPFDQLRIGEKRQRILREQDNQCALCSVGTTWNGQALQLELDHISGDRSDNSRQNLRFICPNCHSQTPTFRGRNKLQDWKGRKVTDDVVLEALRNATSYNHALRLLNFSSHGNNYKRLRRLAADHGIVMGA